MRFRYIIFLFFIFACQQEETVTYSTECAQCVEYEYQQMTSDLNYITVVLDSGIYCVGDYFLEIENSSEFLTVLDDSLLSIMTLNGYCAYLEEASIIE